MRPDALHVLDDARLLVLDRVPFDEVAGRVTAVVMRVRPFLSVEGGGAQVVFEQVGDDLVGKELHPAIGVVDDEPFLRAEQLVRDDERADRVVGRPAAGVADDMRVALGEPGVFGRIEARVHAGENGEAPRRGKPKLALLAEAVDVSLVGCFRPRGRSWTFCACLGFGRLPTGVKASRAPDNHARRH